MTSPESQELDQGGVQTAVIYARVSTDDSDQTVENQLPLCRAYCEKYGYRIVGEYSEEHTGSTINRPKFLEMLGRLSLGDVNYVVVYDQSRLTRSDEPNGDFKYVQKLINDRHALVRFVATDIDPKSDAGKILTSFNSFTNAKFNEELSRKTSIGMQRKKSQAARDIRMHVAEDGDSLREISQRYGVRLKAVLKMNGMTEDTVLREGDVVKLRRK